MCQLCQTNQTASVECRACWHRCSGVTGPTTSCCSISATVLSRCALGASSPRRSVEDMFVATNTGLVAVEQSHQPVQLIAYVQYIGCSCLHGPQWLSSALQRAGLLLPRGRLAHWFPAVNTASDLCASAFAYSTDVTSYPYISCLCRWTSPRYCQRVGGTRSHPSSPA